MRIIGTVMQPVGWTFRNRWFKSTNRTTSFIRDVILLLFGLCLMWLIFLGSRWVLKTASGLIDYAYLSPTLPLGLILLTLSVMLVISNTVSVTGSFFLADDLDIFIGSPVRAGRFFFQRIAIIGLTTSVIPFFFISPIIFSYARWFDQGWRFLLLGVCTLIPYFIIPLGVAFIFASLLVFLVPARRTKFLYFLVVTLMLASVYLAIDLIALVLHAQGDTKGLVQIVKVLTAAYVPWSPSTWASEIFSELLDPRGISVAHRLLLLWSTAACSICLAFLTFQLTYLKANSAIKNHRTSSEQRSILFSLSRYVPPLKLQRISFWIKDLVTLSRDMSQLFQGFLLFGIYLIYIYNLRVFAGFYSLGTIEELWWTNFLFISNFCISAFISSAVCTRFVFPSISLEGQMFPLIKKAPISMRSYMRTKFMFWYLIVASVHSLVVATGAYAAGARPLVLVVNILSSWILCYGLSGLAIGMGAFFSRFDWEHTAQLAVGFGNIIFMLSATALILANMIPVWLLLFATPTEMSGSVSTLAFYLATAVLFCSLNFLVARGAMRFGVKRLEEVEG